MYKLTATCCLIVLMTAPLKADVDSLVSEARGVTMQFGQTLKNVLIGAMKSDGPVKAIDVCNSVAPEIANNVGDAAGWQVARTTLKLRNQDNAPDSWELAVLKDFEQRKAAGEDITKMEATEVVSINGQKTFRYMKAIPTGKPCLACHAGEISAEVETKINELYPQDTARGFKPGDIRGAFTLKKPL